MQMAAAQEAGITLVSVYAHWINGDISDERGSL